MYKLQFLVLIIHIAQLSSSTVDGISDASCISKLFADKYQVLYNSVSYDGTDLQSIMDELNHKISQEATESAYHITTSHVKVAFDRLKPHKSDGCTDLTSDHLKHAGTDLFEHIALLLNSVLIHGTLLENFVYSTIVPMPKGRNVNAADSNNFRGIALSSVYGKLLYNIVLFQFGDELQTSQLQFGFKAKSITNLCTFVLKEALSYYATNQINVFCTFWMPLRPLTGLIIANFFGYC